MKGKVLTSWSLIWLVLTVLFVAGGALNLLAASVRQLPPTDGVLWVQKADGIYAEKVLPGLAASRRRHFARRQADRLGVDGQTFEEVTSPADVPMYLDAAGVGGSLTYFYQKPSYSFANNYYYADLKNIDTLPRWTPSIIFLTIVGNGLARRRHFRPVQTGQPVAVRSAFCDHLSGGVRVSRLQVARASGRISISRSIFWTTPRSPFSRRCFCIFVCVIRSGARYSTTPDGRRTRSMCRRH